jgi:diguanylate cyclase (GGDEF)-like protein/PAS domain S-box-containing protein
VSLRNRIGVLLRRPAVLMAACALPFALLTLVHLLSQRDWQARTAALERENLTLQLRHLALSITRESDELDGVARALADSDGIAELLQENATSPPARLDAADIARLDVNGLLVAAENGTVRFSGALIDHKLIERAPDPRILQYLESLIKTRGTLPATSRGPSAGFADDEFIAARPIVARSSGASLGWVIATRSVAPALLTRLAASVSGSLHAQPIRQFNLATAPADISSWIGSRSSEASQVSTRASGSGSGYAVLRDQMGHAAWVFRLAPEFPASAPAAATETQAGAGMAADTGKEAGAGASQAAGIRSPGFEWAAALAGLAALLAVGLALKHYFRHRRSVDSRYKAIIDQTHDGIVIADSATHQIQYCNPAFLARIGYTSVEAKSLSLSEVFADGNAAPESVLARLKSADSQMALNLQLRCKSGALIDIEVRCNRLDVDGRDGLAYVTHDVSVRRKAEQQLIDNQQRLDRMAHHDQLTSLPNRHYLTTFLPAAIEEARAGNTMLGVVFLDLDRFKHINDTRGHETGDKLLQEVARRLRACVRDSDVVIRMGGDEFVVILRNVKSYDEVTLGANRIIESLNIPIVIDQHPLQTTGSVGVSLFPRDGDNMGELLKHSDTAMYQAKDRGRNNVQMFSQIMNRKLKHRVAMEASLREALRLKQLDVHYQPFVNLHTRKVVGLEALIRWHHPVHGMIPADQFIPVAEETGLIVPMGNFVLHRTLQTMSAWQKAGVTLVPMSLNVAPAQLQRGELQSTISTLLKTHALRPELLQLEMTERAVFDSSQSKPGENRQDTMARLRDLGIKIAIDDFGTGYSSSELSQELAGGCLEDRPQLRPGSGHGFERSCDRECHHRHCAAPSYSGDRRGHRSLPAGGDPAETRLLGGPGFLFARPLPADQCLAMLSSEALGVREEEDMLAVFASGRA